MEAKTIGNFGIEATESQTDLAMYRAALTEGGKILFQLAFVLAMNVERSADRLGHGAVRGHDRKVMAFQFGVENGICGQTRVFALAHGD